VSKLEYNLVHVFHQCHNVVDMTNNYHFILPCNTSSNTTVYQIYINNIWLQVCIITLEVQYIIRLFRATGSSMVYKYCAHM
jgi:hypothetical protein